MNWGKGIVIGMLIFVTFIAGLSAYMFTVPADDYDQQYYEKGLAFDSEYDRERQVVTDHAQPTILQNGNALVVNFTKPSVGTIKFISNLGKKNDRVFDFDTANGNTTQIPVNKLASGRWNTLLTWTAGQKSYLYKKEIYVNR